MKLLFYSHSSTKYGATSSMVNLIMGIKKLYPEVKAHVVLPKNGPLESYLWEQDIGFSVLPNRSWYYSYELSQRKKDQNYLLWKAWFLKNKWQKRLFNKFHFKSHIEFTKSFSPDFIYVNSSLAPMGTYVATKLNIPLIWHHRETVDEEAYNYFLEYPELFKRNFKQADLHIYTSKFLQKFYDNYESKNNNLIVFNGVDFKTSGKAKPVPTEFPFLKFGIVGRINSQKGQEEVIRVFHKFRRGMDSPKFHHELHLIGGGREEYIQEIGCSDPENNVFFHGFLDKDHIFSKFDFLIMNSTNEAFGRVVAEANMHGIPVIAKYSGAFPEIIKEGVNGFLYHNAEELLKVIDHLTSEINIETYKRLSESSRKEFEENFSIEDYTHTIISCIREMK